MFGTSTGVCSKTTSYCRLDMEQSQTMFCFSMGPEFSGVSFKKGISKQKQGTRNRMGRGFLSSGVDRKAFFFLRRFSSPSLF